MNKQRDPKASISASSDSEICGVIMPISATSSHDKSHWDDMLELLSRAISDAGCSMQPVWVNSSTDRVSERIIGNIFKYPVVIADITDLNPNVMFELGLRLASKKPTLVVMEDGGIIPFDIRDFHIHLYPRNLSILGMEKFISNLSQDIRAKKEAFAHKEYTPFLSTVVVDVVSPDQREVSMNKFLLDQLEELNRRVANLSNPIDNKRPPKQDLPTDLIVSSFNNKKGAYFAQIGESEADTFTSSVKSTEFRTIEIARENGKVYFALVVDGDLFKLERDEIRKKFDAVIGSSNAIGNVPRHICDRYKF